MLLFHGVVGIESATHYSLENRRFWKMDGFIPLPMHSDETTTDLPAIHHPSARPQSKCDMRSATQHVGGYRVGTECARTTHCAEKVQIPATGEIYCLPRITFSFNPARSSWSVNCKQFPLRLAYATTFNGSQGLTLQRAVVDDGLAHGQSYTALASVRHRRDIRTLWS